MFTGIVKELAPVKKIETKKDLKRIALYLNLDKNKVTPGDSIAVNGVCLTVTKAKDSLVFFDIMKETLAKSNLSLLKESDKVNIEFSLKGSDNIGGHFVSGHIDCLGRIKARKNVGEVTHFEIFIPQEFNKYITPKASITVNGISLTIVKSFSDYFTFYSIAYTLNHTTLKNLKIGDSVNIEFDLLAKYVDKIIQSSSSSSGISLEFLKEKDYL